MRGVHQPAIERFLEKFEIDEGSGCWLWTAALKENGYAHFWDGAKNAYGHRFAYQHLVGPIPAGLDLDHLCRVRHCVNPEHLEPVTRQQNLLRGATIPARNAAKTHCSKGHAYDDANTRFIKNGSRHCKACELANNRVHQQRRKMQCKV